jgi:hypothetical protein
MKRRDTHIDSLLERLSLKENRVSRVLDSVSAGTNSFEPHGSDDRRYCLELGLVKEDENKKLRPANAVYKEVMARVITDQIQYALDDKIAAMEWTDGQIIFMSKILQEFQKFWRQTSLSCSLGTSSLDLISSISLDGIDPDRLVNNPNLYSFIRIIKDLLSGKYNEAAYSFLLAAFLQKTVSGGALIRREFAEGRGAAGLGAVFKNHQYLIEVKLRGQKTWEESLEQLAGYLDTNGEKEGWLVIFERSIEKKREDMIYFRTLEFKNFIINVAGC